MHKVPRLTVDDFIIATSLPQVPIRHLQRHVPLATVSLPIPAQQLDEMILTVVALQGSVVLLLAVMVPIIQSHGSSLQNVLPSHRIQCVVVCCGHMISGGLAT